MGINKNIQSQGTIEEIKLDILSKISWYSNMYKLGITGGMGSGKSTASNFFLKKGALVFDADKQAKKYLLTDLHIQNRIIDAFGNYVIQNQRKENIQILLLKIMIV